MLINIIGKLGWTTTSVRKVKSSPSSEDFPLPGYFSLIGPCSLSRQSAVMFSYVDFKAGCHLAKDWADRRLQKGLRLRFLESQILKNESMHKNNHDIQYLNSEDVTVVEQVVSSQSALQPEQFLVSSPIWARNSLAAQGLQVVEFSPFCGIQIIKMF